MIVHYDLNGLIPFAVPLASQEFTLQLMQTIRKASYSRQCKRGVKEVIKALRKEQKG
jgi:H/ACA ribonucleoprotein complex subunit 2